MDINAVRKLEWLVVWSRKAKSVRMLKIPAMCLTAGIAVFRHWSLTTEAWRMYTATAELLFCILYIQVTASKSSHHMAMD